MSLLRNITTGLRSLFRKAQVDRDLDEELRAYQEMAVEDKMKDGMTCKEALRAVRLERGSLELSKRNRSLWRLGILSRDVLAGPSVCRPNAAQVSRLYRRCALLSRSASEQTLRYLRSSTRLCGPPCRLAILGKSFI